MEEMVKAGVISDGNSTSYKKYTRLKNNDFWAFLLFYIIENDKFIYYDLDKSIQKYTKFFLKKVTE